MTTSSALAVSALGFALAFANGSNDVSKGVATLVGSGLADYRRALVWAALGALSEFMGRFFATGCRCDACHGRNTQRKPIAGELAVASW